MNLILDPRDVIVPSKYKCGEIASKYDIALIGLSRTNKLKVDEYLIHKNENNPQKYKWCYNINDNINLGFLDDPKEALNNMYENGSYLADINGFSGSEDFISYTIFQSNKMFNTL